MHFVFAHASTLKWKTASKTLQPDTARVWCSAILYNILFYVDWNRCRVTLTFTLALTLTRPHQHIFISILFFLENLHFRNHFQKPVNSGKPMDGKRKRIETDAFSNENVLVWRAWEQNIVRTRSNKRETWFSIYIWQHSFSFELHLTPNQKQKQKRDSNMIDVFLYRQIGAETDISTCTHSSWTR